MNPYVKPKTQKLEKTKQLLHVLLKKENFCMRKKKCWEKKNTKEGERI